mmetsp:Transcript_1043/g.936  ORF Transcript_1043/g.936 Transcript_1043/m.936 type:complete len:96 (-) Transcript_1043:670-957(-)
MDGSQPQDYPNDTPDPDMMPQNQSDDVSEDQMLQDKYKQSKNKVYHDFFKTKLCNLYYLNICKKGKNCPFAHSYDELREKPNLEKTKLCEAFMEG